MTPERRQEVFWGHVLKGPSCWIWTASKVNGYGRFRVDGVWVGAHRYAYEITYGRPIPDGWYACHHCDNPSCVNPSHIFPGTPTDNVRDCMAKGRKVNPPRSVRTGEKHWNAKLTASQVNEIRSSYASEVERYGVFPRLAKRFGVSPQTVHKICSGTTWRSVA